MLDNRRQAPPSVRPPLVEASTGRTSTIEEMSEDVDALAAALYQDLGWSSRKANDAKVVGVVCLNSVCFSLSDSDVCMYLCTDW